MSQRVFLDLHFSQAVGPRVLGVDSTAALLRAGDLESGGSLVVVIRTRFDGLLLPSGDFGWLFSVG